MNHLEEIRAKLSIEEVVGGYLQLKKAGRNLKGLCPFHSDSNPSFTVSPEKGIAYCFACNTGGDVFKFIQLIEKVEFPEALRILAERANVTLPTFRPEARDEKARLVDINQKAISFFADFLEKNPNQKRYLSERGLSEDSIRSFQLGLAPDSYHGLKDALIQAGFSEKELLSAGVITQRDMADKNTYDRFRNRIIFPIFDHQGNPIGFGGRIIDEGEPKYLNSPETPLYNKSMVLYGLSWGKEMIKKEDRVIFVEGYMDVLTAHQAGTRNAVATSGTALTPQQIKLIKRYTHRISFAFDQDSAGLEATKRAIEIAQEQGMEVSIIQIPEGKDPDECIRKAPEKWMEAIAHPVPVMDFYFSYVFSKHDKTNMEGKKAALAELLPLIKQYPSHVERNEYLERLAREIKTDAKFLWNDLKNLKHAPVYAATAAPSGPPPKQVFSREEFLLGFILNYPSLYPVVHENLIDHIAFDPKTEKFYKAFKNLYNRQSTVDREGIVSEIGPEESEKADVYSLLIEEHYPDFSEGAAEREMKQLSHEINKRNLHQAQKDFEIKIRSTQDNGEKILLLNQYNQILKLRSKVSF